MHNGSGSKRRSAQAFGTVDQTLRLKTKMGGQVIRGGRWVLPVSEPGPPSEQMEIVQGGLYPICSELEGNQTAIYEFGWGGHGGLTGSEWGKKGLHLSEPSRQKEDTEPVMGKQAFGRRGSRKSFTGRACFCWA